MKDAGMRGDFVVFRVGNGGAHGAAGRQIECEGSPLERWKRHGGCASEQDGVSCPKSGVKCSDCLERHEENVQRLMKQ